MSDRSLLRLLPAVERVLNLPPILSITAKHGRAAVTDWVRDVLATLRDGPGDALPSDADRVESMVVEQVTERATGRSAQRLRKVINATGIVLHTNLGRAPLAAAAIQALQDAAECSNVELDLTSGERGRRGAAVEVLLEELTGAAASLVVNNCAAATLLTLQTLSGGRRVVISRGQLIEIGGSFRLPDVFRHANVTLHEVGTTNRTRLSDYSAALGPETAALLRVHPSNYRITGFSETVGIAELAALGKERGVLVVDDVGSGCLYDLAVHGWPDEPMVGESLRAGADLVLFSGDKLLGGPQCGIIVGRSELIGQLRANPLARTLRVDKLTLAALQATLEIHRSGRAFTEIPVLRQLTMSADEIRLRAERVLQDLQASTSLPGMFSVQGVESASGGGALPGMSLPSFAIAAAAAKPDDFLRQLRLGEPAVLARVKDDRVLFDLRTVLPHNESALVERMLAYSYDGSTPAGEVG